MRVALPGARGKGERAVNGDGILKESIIQKSSTTQIYHSHTMWLPKESSSSISVACTKDGGGRSLLSPSETESLRGDEKKMMLYGYGCYSEWKRRAEVVPHKRWSVDGRTVTAKQGTRSLNISCFHFPPSTLGYRGKRKSRGEFPAEKKPPKSSPLFPFLQIRIPRSLSLRRRERGEAFGSGRIKFLGLPPATG